MHEIMEHSSKDDGTNYAGYVENFRNKKQKFEKQKKEFEELKKEFYRIMEDCFKESNEQEAISFGTDKGHPEKQLIVKRSCKTSVSFDVDKIKTIVGKELSKEVIDTTFTIYDCDAFLKYLKSIGASAGVVKEFVDVSRKVNVDTLDNLIDTGKIDEDKIKDACEVTKGNPYFTVRARTVEDADENR